MKEIYLAGGCFWGTDAYFRNLDGVIKTEVGYANGDGEETFYENLSLTGHAETVKLIFDENIISLDDILEHFYYIINPFSLNQQGADIGRQYRTGIYSKDDRDSDFARKFLSKKQELTDRKIQVEVDDLKNYVRAEEYHQDYLIKHPDGYCHVNLSDVWEKNDEN